MEVPNIMAHIIISVVAFCRLSGVPALTIVSCTLTVCLCLQILSSVCNVAIGQTANVRDEQLQTTNVNRQIGLAGCRRVHSPVATPP